MPSLSENTIYGRCHDCDGQNNMFCWCSSCEISSFRRSFETWKTGSIVLDELIRLSQNSAGQGGDYIEYVPFGDMEHEEEFGYGAHSTVSKAEWLEGPRIRWDRSTLEWYRHGPTTVALKRIHHSKEPASSDFIHRITTRHLKALQNHSVADTLGITIHPTGDLVFILRYYNGHDLAQFLHDNPNTTFAWKVYMLFDIANGLNEVHRLDLCHGNLHGGNVLVEDDGEEPVAKLADVGICGPVSPLVPPSGGVYGVLPYVAPEVLRGGPPSKEADMYAFGILMWQMATNQRPFADQAHDLSLAREIVNGERPPDIDGLFPRDLAGIMEECLLADPSRRPKITQVNDWLSEYTNHVTDINEEFTLENIVGKTEFHPKAVYTSRWLSFPELQ